MQGLDKMQADALARARGENEPAGARQKAYEEGRAAFANPSLLFCDNPYNGEGQTYIHAAWADGYNDAADDCEG